MPPTEAAPPVHLYYSCPPGRPQVCRQWKEAVPQARGGRPLGSRNTPFLVEFATPRFDCKGEPQVKAIELAKAYDPKDFEGRLYRFWLEQGLFQPSPKASGKPFVIVIP